MTIAGTVLGIAAFVAVLGLTTTASGQISKRFTALQATEVTLQDAPQDPGTAGIGFPTDTEDRLDRLNGVRHSGVFWTVQIAGSDNGTLVSARPPWTAGTDTEPLNLIAASPGYLAAVHSRFRSGRSFDLFHQRTSARVCLLGEAAAERLGIRDLSMQPAIFVGDDPLTVVGIISDVDRRPETLLSVVVPSSTATDLWGRPTVANGSVPRVLIETRLGAAELIGRQAPYALRPDDPGRFKVTVPPDPKFMKSQVTGDLSTLFIALAGLCLVVGTAGIANTTLVAVLERVAEIGLRRSLGARSRDIAGQFITEAAMLGFLGGLLGTSAGVLTVVLTAVGKHWTPVLEPAVVLPAPLLGALTGLLAGLYPAWRASRIEPAEALRR
ncbi:ABC transporter permease [Actinoallomurus acanthiterrae]